MRSVTQTWAQPKLIRKNVYSGSHSGSPSRRLRLAVDLALDRSFEARKRIEEVPRFPQILQRFEHALVLADRELDSRVLVESCRSLDLLGGAHTVRRPRCSQSPRQTICVARRDGNRLPLNLELNNLRHGRRLASAPSGGAYRTRVRR
jgi:hypothetical protein